MEMRDQRDGARIRRRRKGQCTHLIQGIRPMDALVHRKELLQKGRHEVVHVGDGGGGTFLRLHCGSGKAWPFVVQAVAPYRGLGETCRQDLLLELLHQGRDACRTHSLACKRGQRVHVPANYSTYQRYLWRGHGSRGGKAPLEWQSNSCAG